MKLFLDANILFTAAHNPAGKSAFIIELGVDGYFELVTCELAVEEASRNLDLKFPKARKQLDTFLNKIESKPTVTKGRCPVELPEKDRPILLSAIHSKATHLVTGDVRDFGKYMNRPNLTAGVILQTPSQFLNSI